MKKTLEFNNYLLLGLISLFLISISLYYNYSLLSLLAVVPCSIAGMTLAKLEYAFYSVQDGPAVNEQIGGGGASKGANNPAGE